MSKKSENKTKFNNQELKIKWHFSRISLLIINLLIGRRRKNGNQHKINIPTTMPNVFARIQKNKQK